MTSEYFSTNVKLLRFVGAWNDYPEGSKRRKAYQAFTTLLVIILLLHLYTEFAFIVSHVGDIEALTDGVNLTSVYLLTYLKMLVVVWRYRELAEVVADLRSGDVHPASGPWGEETDILNEGGRRADWMTKYFIGMTGSATCLFFLNAAVTLAPSSPPLAGGNSSTSVHEGSRRIVLYPAQFPFDIANDARNHAAALFFQFLGPGIFGASLNVAADMLLVSVLIHLRSHFRALSYLLGSLDCRVDEASNAAVIGTPSSTIAVHGNEELRYQLLTEYISRHQELYRLSDAVSKIFSPVLFLQCFYSSCSYCIILFHLTMVHSSGVALMKNVLFLLTIMGQLLVFCWFGMNIFEESLSVNEAAYNTSWFRSSPRFKNSIALMICRAQRPVLLTGAHLYPINLETFSAMLSGAFSYYTVLRKIYAED